LFALIILTIGSLFYLTSSYHLSCTFSARVGGWLDDDDLCEKREKKIWQT